MRLPDAMAFLDSGGSVFTPSLDLFAPELTRVAVIAPSASSPAPQEQPTGSPKRSLWKRLFGDDTEEEEHEPTAAETVASQPPVPVGGNATQSTANFPLLLDFQGGTLFGGTDSGAPFVHIALSDSPEYRVPVSDDKSGGITPEPAPSKADDSRVYRRPAEDRRIRGIALLAPAGGMLFDGRSLASIKVPVAIVEAGQDGLYPPERHVQPYYTGFPARPLALRIEGADHFSLFALCSRNTLNTLGEACGRLTGEGRQEVARKRDMFLVSFFQSVLGRPLSPASPSGLVALPPVTRQ